MRKKMTVTVSSVKPGEIKEQLIVEGKAKGYSVKFDVVTSLYTVKEGEKLLFEFRDSPPANPEKYVFCGHGYVVRDPKLEYEQKPDFTVFSVWGILFKFSPPLKDLEPDKKYYLCISRVE